MKTRLLEDIAAPTSSFSHSSAHIANGIPIPAVKRIEIFSAEEWEEFVEEWTQSLMSSYKEVKRLAGAGDKGRDIVGFCDNDRFSGVWDLYQCKHYQNKLQPSDVWIEIGKLIYHTKQDGYKPPRKFYFVAPKGPGIKLSGILLDKEKIKQGLKENWENHCRDQIESGKAINLEGDLLLFFENFDFSIFAWMTSVELVSGHATTAFHATRFGGGLPPISKEINIPEQVQDIEHRYVNQLLEAYSDHTKKPLTTVDHLENHQDIKKHFSRSRESFYSAESLRNFARDNVAPGTFESLQDDVYDGVIDTCEMNYSDGYERIKNTTNKAVDLPLANNPLHTATSPRNKQGICHQLSNDDRLTWVKKK